jgi:hypothetical protein
MHSAQTWSSAAHLDLVPTNPSKAAASSQASLHTAPKPTTERPRRGDLSSGPHTHSSRSSRDQNCVRPCCQSSTTPYARALPSSFFSSHDEKHARIAREQIPTSRHAQIRGEPRDFRPPAMTKTVCAVNGPRVHSAVTMGPNRGWSSVSIGKDLFAWLC